MLDATDQSVSLDEYTEELFNELYSTGPAGTPPDTNLAEEIRSSFEDARLSKLTQPILHFFSCLLLARRENSLSPDDFGLTRKDLIDLAQRHESIDEHGVTVGGRINRAIPIVLAANKRVRRYMTTRDQEAPSGIDLWLRIQENVGRIKEALSMNDDDWYSYQGQLRHAIDSVDTLSKILELPPAAIHDVLRVTQSYRMRITPYYASLIQPGQLNDPVLMQCVPTGEMVDAVGDEIPPVAADHSPARLIDQFYPRVTTIKSTNMCAMYCTHCLRIAHIGAKDRIYSREAYGEALDYIRNNRYIRDVLVTGGDAFVLPNDMIRWLLGELDKIEHVRTKRLGTRIPVTAPMRIDQDLLDVLGESNDIKPLRVVTQINTAQEITPLSREGFKALSGRVMAVMNQAVLLKGINDSPVKMWKLCETIQEAYVRPYYIFNCSYRNPQFSHLRVPVEVGRDIVESMYGNISGDAIPRYICTAGGKVPMHRDNVMGRDGSTVALRKPWSGEEVPYPDADPVEYERTDFAFARYSE
ncbi:MAG: KamA family radical SAM protein [Deltaproteobacteria bacterium]|nr:KamA family radical SAM protein [Deltaproteobacteria bacterium]